MPRWGGNGMRAGGWNAAVENKEQRREQNLATPAIGQMGSSTRQELIGWLLALSLPIRSMYATDSASMLSKAKMLIAAAIKKQEEEEIKKSNEVSRIEPLILDNFKS